VNRKLLFLSSLLLLLTFFILFISNLVTPSPAIFTKGTIVGSVDVSGKTFDEGVKMLEKVFSDPVYLNFRDSSRAVTLREIGLDFDPATLEKALVICRIRNPSLFCTNLIPDTNQRAMGSSSSDAVTIDETALNTYLDSLEEEVQFMAQNTVISYDDYSFRVPSSEARVKIDRSSILESYISDLVSPSQVKIRVRTDTTDNTDLQKTKTDNLIETISQPLLIKYGRNPVHIPKENLKSFFVTREVEGLVYGYILEEKVSEYLNELHEKYGSEDVVVMHPEAIRAIRHALLLRAANTQINNAVILPLEGKPRTDGSLHDVYLEVIKSQQRLYRFEQGKLVKTYIISTGLTWETPPGTYSILGKQKMTISYFGNWYMPDYLPIGLIKGQYKFGFHAIPYHMDGSGNIYSRDPNTMGSPATGGCIQLQPDEATELFEWAVVGVPVYIYE
jgi:hypothetical protein